MVPSVRRLITVVMMLVATVLMASPALAAAPPTVAAPAYRQPIAATRLVVCKPTTVPNDSVGRQLFAECRFHDIQAAIDAVSQRGTTIYVLPGRYQETPSRAPLSAQCAVVAKGTTPSAGCPHAQGLISVFGDAGSCVRCDLQLEGIGNVVVDGSGADSRPVGILADQASGLYVRNLTVSGFSRNGLEVDATDGFTLDQVKGDANGLDGIAAVGADHGVIADCEASGNGDSGLATTSASNVQGVRSSIEIRGCRSDGNVVGYSGTAGDSVYVHDNDFFANSTGVSMDSAAPVTGMPQNHASFVANRVYSNNADFYPNVWKGLCGKPRVICPVRAVPVGTGLLLAGGDENTYAGNLIYDNWRYGAAQYWVPRSRRGALGTTPDTSDGNRYLGNLMGFTPTATPAPNGVDFWWDEQGTGNCWQNNPSEGSRTDPATLPNCQHPSAGGPYATAGNPVKSALVTACAGYLPQVRQEPTGCTWLQAPAKPY
jgi:Right handed beta helix region